MSKHWFNDPIEMLFEDFIEVESAPRWVGPSIGPEQNSPRIVVHGYDLTGAMVYLAPLGSRWTTYSEPSQIDLDLPIKGGKSSGMPTYYVRTYRDLAPPDRRAYLAWLAGGRTDPNADRAFIRLYLHGLERRLLIDGLTAPLMPEEMAVIATQLSDLKARYADRMHMGFLDPLLAIVFALMLPPDADLPNPPPIDAMTWEEPHLLRYGIGRFSMQNRPIPADWAAVWAWYRRDVVIRSALLSTPEEFRALFAHHYTEQFGEGLRFKPGKRMVSITYHASNPTVGTTTISFAGIPEVYSRPSGGQKLRPIVEQVWHELGSYARAVNRVYGADKTLATAALLPPVLQTRDRPEIDEALRWVEDQLGDATSVHIPEAELVDLWWPRSWDGSPAVQQLAAKDRKAFITMLGRFNLGAEPDARYGKRPGLPPLRDGLTIFRSTKPIPETPGKSWNSAVVAAQYGAALLAQDGGFDAAAAAHLAAEVAGTFRTAPTEDTRLQVWLQALAEQDDPVKITGIKPFLDHLTPAQRERVIAFVLDVATRTSGVSPDAVSLVQKIARALGLDAAEMPSRLFAAMTGTGSSPARGKPARASQRARTLALDHAVIAATEAATAAVTDLLGDILRDDDHPAVTVPEPAPSLESGAGESRRTIAGLDAAHSALLAALADSEADVWSADALDALARAHDLLGTGAIDTLNDAALDVVDEMVIEESAAGYRVDRDVLTALMHRDQEP